MIPKTIHYCWFGRNPKPGPVKKCIRSWKEHCPDYRIIEWNEDNFVLDAAPLYVRQAYEAKKWAFVTDYVRLQVVFENGGIYLDTDVEVIRSLDGLLNNKAYFGFETEQTVNTGHGFGSEKGSPILLDLMADYQSISFLAQDGTPDTLPCPERNTAVLRRHGLVPDGSEQVLDGYIHIYPGCFFSPKDYKTGEIHCTENTFTIHHFDSSWHTGFEKYLRRKQRSFLKQYGPEQGLEKMKRWRRKHRVLIVLFREGPEQLLKKVGQRLFRRDS